MADLSGADLRGADLREAKLVSALLSGANLSGAKLFRANLAGADLNEAKFARTYFREANLSGANLAGAKAPEAKLVGARLRGAKLNDADVGRADLSETDLSEADLRGATLFDTNLTAADLSGANLARANLIRANLSWAQLVEANLGEANLSLTILYGANLTKADLQGSVFHATILASVNLSSCTGLESCVHRGQSNLDYRTLQRSGLLPRAFLRGVGLPDNLIDQLPRLLGPIQFYSPFISHSSKDQVFVDRLHADLQAKGVRCWFAPHDMPIGAKILDAIDEAIRLQDKVLLVLSEGAIASDWVEGEVTRALEEERERGRLVLVPISIDGAVWQTTEAWARLLRVHRSIGDFTRWKEHDAYNKAFDKLVSGLKVEAAGQPPAG